MEQSWCAGVGLQLLGWVFTRAIPQGTEPHLAWGEPLQAPTEAALAFRVLGRRHQAFILLAGRFLIPFPGRTQFGFLCAPSACGEHTLRGAAAARTNAIVGGLGGLQVLSVGAV